MLLLQYLIFLLQPPKPAPVGLPAPASRGRLCCREGLNAPYYSHRWLGHPSTHPHPLLFCSDDSLTLVLLFAWASSAAYSPAPCCSLPRPRRRPPPWCSRRGLVNMVNERHPSAVACTRKIMIPPPDSWDPPEGHLYLAKKTFPPLTCRTHELYLRTQGSASLLRTKK